MQRGLVIVAVLLVLGTLYAIAYAEKGYRVVAVYVAGNLSAEHLDLVETIECNGSLKAAIYASNHTKGPSLVIIYAPRGAEYSRTSIAQCLGKIIGESPGTMYLPLGFTIVAQAKASPRKNVEKSIVTSTNNVTQGLSSQVTTTTTRLVAKVTRTTITPIMTTTATTKKATTTQEVLYSSASASASTATPVSMPGTEHTGRGAGLSPSERLGLVLGSAIAAAVLVYVAWRIKIG